MTNDEAKAAVNQLCDIAGIGKVISVDDMFAETAAIADVIVAVNKLEPTVAAALFPNYQEIQFAGDPEVRNDQLRQLWDRLENGEKEEIVGNLRSKISTTDDIDWVAKQLFAEVFSDRNFAGLSLAAWKEKRDSLLADETTLLLLVDEDFTKERGGTATDGLSIIKDVLKSTSSEKAMCGLVSHNYLPADVHDDWEKLCAEHGFDKSRFVLIPKALADDDLGGFASLIKLSLVASSLDRLRTRALDILIDCLSDTQKHLEKINIYDLEEIVFQSSLQEGVWEPETLLRVFALFHRQELRKKAFNDDELKSLSSKIRPISVVKTASPKQPAHRIWPIQHLEMFDDAEILNPLHIPLEAGDIFKSGQKRYILIFPPCDLAVRSDGTREAVVREAVVAEIRADRRPNASWELKYLDKGSTLYLDFKKTHSVKLTVLDLVVFNPDGSAKIQLDQIAPKGIIPSWQKRFEFVKKSFEEIAVVYNRISPSKQQRDDVVRALFRCSNEQVFIPSYLHDTNQLQYDFSRVGRLVPPRSTMLLQKYAEFLTREAFEKDLETGLAAE